MNRTLETTKRAIVNDPSKVYCHYARNVSTNHEDRSEDAQLRSRVLYGILGCGSNKGVIKIYTGAAIVTMNILEQFRIGIKMISKIGVDSRLI